MHGQGVAPCQQMQTTTAFGVFLTFFFFFFPNFQSRGTIRPLELSAGMHQGV